MTVLEWLRVVKLMRGKGDALPNELDVSPPMEPSGAGKTLEVEPAWLIAAHVCTTLLLKDRGWRWCKIRCREL